MTSFSEEKEIMGNMKFKTDFASFNKMIITNSKREWSLLTDDVHATRPKLIFLWAWTWNCVIYTLSVTDYIGWLFGANVTIFNLDMDTMFTYKGNIIHNHI